MTIHHAISYAIGYLSGYSSGMLGDAIRCFAPFTISLFIWEPKKGMMYIFWVIYHENIV